MTGSRFKTRFGETTLTPDFETLVRTYRPRVFRFALASLRDWDAAETVTQDCFFRAYQAQGKFRHDCNWNTWLLQIAVNLVRDYTRSKRLQFWKRIRLTAEPVEALDAFVDGQRSPEAQILLREQVAAVWEVVASLPERQRTVFLLRFVEDLDILEIAATTGMKEGTVKAHLFRALQAVRERMAARK